MAKTQEEIQREVEEFFNGIFEHCMTIIPSSMMTITFSKARVLTQVQTHHPVLLYYSYSFGSYLDYLQKSIEIEDGAQYFKGFFPRYLSSILGSYLEPKVSKLYFRCFGHRESESSVGKILNFVMSGFIVDLTISLLLYPLDFATTRCLSDFGDEPTYSSCFDCLTQAIETEGWRSLYTGVSYLPLKLFVKWVGLALVEQFSLKSESFMSLMINNNVKTVVSNLFSHPFDTAMRRSMVSGVTRSEIKGNVEVAAGSSNYDGLWLAVLDDCISFNTEVVVKIMFQIMAAVLKD